MTRDHQTIISQLPEVLCPCHSTIILRINSHPRWVVIRHLIQTTWVPNRIPARPVLIRDRRNMALPIRTLEDTECKADIPRNVRTITMAVECTTVNDLE